VTGDERPVAQGSTLAPVSRPGGDRRLLVDRVIPRVPVRHWVLSFPIPLRGLFAVHPELLAPVLQTIHRVIATHRIRQAANAVKWASAPSPSSSASAQRPIIAAIEEPALIERLLMQAWRCVRFRELGQAASGSEHAAAFLQTGHSAGIFFTSAVEIRERLVFTNFDFDDDLSERQLSGRGDR
jgi:hypothetical protein